MKCVVEKAIWQLFSMFVSTTFSIFYRFSGTNMAPFRWSLAQHNLQLATEVAATRPNAPAEWETVAQILSVQFSTDEKTVELSGRACREHMDRLLKKFEEEDMESLKK